MSQVRLGILFTEEIGKKFDFKTPEEVDDIFGSLTIKGETYDVYGTIEENHIDYNDFKYIIYLPIDNEYYIGSRHTCCSYSVEDIKEYMDIFKDMIDLGAFFSTMVE